MRAGPCLGPEGNGVSSGEGGEGAPGLPRRGEDRQSTPSKKGDNMEKEEEGRTGGRDEEEPACTEWAFFKKAFCSSVIGCNITNAKVNTAFVSGE
jgi:hypothetical protein